MLKRLELVGFKSFADKTPFDFTGGVTAIVGPNGSGKSNIVDAVRWIMGEQSAKSLRGGEMADVIFNGSASRRGFGMAEVTMTFDNAARQLATDAPEVQITRRVYRSGEGEYLINQQPCRLKDIKELFLGSGAGSNAYCIIEQGRVESLLQASTKDRRFIFEEAAGISRFKARKIETLRKLERVDLNLQRLRDILDEVDKQLRSVKLQASKAQRYQEYSTRLRELRVALGLHDYHFLSEKLQAQEDVLERLKENLARQTAQAGDGETAARRLDEDLSRVEAAVREQETLQAQARQQIATEELTLTHEQTTTANLESELVQDRGRLTELTARVAELTETAATAARDCAGVDTECQTHRTKVHGIEDELQSAVVRITNLQRQAQADKTEHFEQMRKAGHLRNDAVSCKAQMDNLVRELEKLRLKGAQAEEHLATIDVELQTLTTADEKLQTRLTASRQHLGDQTQERERLRTQADATANQVADLKAQRSGLASRIDILDGLEKTHEGLGAGIREVFGLLDGGAAEGWNRELVPGMVADFLTVRREYAPLIDLALGDAAQRFLVRDVARLNDVLKQRTQPFASRVSFLPLPPARPQERQPLPEPPAFAALGTHGVLAVQVVTCDDSKLAELPTQLLGQTRIVPDLATARALAAETAGLRFVTLQGELLEADGTLTVGTYHPEAGILSRKSELRELRSLALTLDEQIVDAERAVADLRQRGLALDSQVGSLQQEIAALADQAADLRTRIGQHKERRSGLHEEVTLSRSEMSGIQLEVTSLDEAFRKAQELAEAADGQVQAIQQRLDQAEQEIRNREAQRQLQQQDYTAAKVALATIDERLSALRGQQRQAETDLTQRRQELQQSAQQVANALTRLQESQRAMLHASAALAVCYLHKEAAEKLLTEQAGQRDALRLERQGLSERLQAAQSAWRQLQEEAHTTQLQASDLQHRLTTLADRLREDYQLDLGDHYRTVRSQKSEISDEVAAGGVAPVQPWDLTPEHIAKSNEEIEELRRKLSRLGSVNMDALAELNELEGRATALQTQCDDLTAAQKSLQEIIAKINHDSRKLFTDVFQTIRTHFQELFRKLFGGGMADIVLEDETDILESGIEVIARPPGKELRSISLMSGGEKTMTAVALLLAIFRSKPSPFCILDEVDAALDEANIGRFTAVLRDFLDRSQFILITHSKKTMACADVLYGITMQESGISKRVAVRFEDWPNENGDANGHTTAAAANQEPGFAGR